ncbi:MAG: ferredoxin [Armatimonadetes bacterium]|nr:ferredoxin [Armatimonadota bacterium]
MITRPGESNELEVRALSAGAELMCLAARTAPKARGADNVCAAVVTGPEKAQLAAQMRAIAETENAPFFARDAANVEAAPVVVVLGTRLQRMNLPACGLCGFADCDQNAAAGAQCIFPAHDLGIAIGSAVAVAAAHHADNRVMFSVGVAALRLNLLGDDVRLAFGVPLSATGKSPFFDRK